ncbi:hypothetical protein DFH06DRAFT_1466390, partial [Mycena polygramma]
ALSNARACCVTPYACPPSRACLYYQHCVTRDSCQSPIPPSVQTPGCHARPLALPPPRTNRDRLACGSRRRRPGQTQLHTTARQVCRVCAPAACRVPAAARVDARRRACAPAAPIVCVPVLQPRCPRHARIARHCRIPLGDLIAPAYCSLPLPASQPPSQRRAAFGVRRVAERGARTWSGDGDVERGCRAGTSSGCGCAKE